MRACAVTSNKKKKLQFAQPIYIAVQKSRTNLCGNCVGENLCKCIYIYSVTNRKKTYKPLLI